MLRMHGQIDAASKYVARGPGYNIFFALVKLELT